MKYKMAPNSLFAILLRSPWWISVAIAVSLTLGANALLPPQYVLFGAISSLPFVVIAVMAARKQFTTMSAKRVDEILQALAAMSWRDFSAELEKAFARDGGSVTRLNNDAAADFEVFMRGTVTLVNAKRWKAATHGTEPIEALGAAMKKRGADVSAGVYIAIGGVSDKARKLAPVEGIDVIDGANLAQLMRDLPAPKR